MPIHGEIAIVGGPKAHVKQFQPFLKDALQNAVLLWHRSILPRHFELQAFGRYHYKNRSRKWRERKQREVGHNLPLVFTGQLKRAVTTRVTISGTARAATAALRGPSYLYAYNKNANQPDKAAELRKTTNGEEGEMGTVVDTELTDKLNRLQTRETIRI